MHVPTSLQASCNWGKPPQTCSVVADQIDNCPFFGAAVYKTAKQNPNISFARFGTIGLVGRCFTPCNQAPSLTSNTYQPVLSLDSYGNALDLSKGNTTWAVSDPIASNPTFEEGLSVEALVRLPDAGRRYDVKNFSSENCEGFLSCDLRRLG